MGVVAFQCVKCSGRNRMHFTCLNIDDFTNACDAVVAFYVVLVLEVQLAALIQKRIVQRIAKAIIAKQYAAALPSFTSGMPVSVEDVLKALDDHICNSRTCQSVPIILLALKVSLHACLRHLGIVDLQKRVSFLVAQGPGSRYIQLRDGIGKTSEIFMCTIGALRIENDEYLLFKNKDFSISEFSDRVTLNADVFGPLGLETFAQEDAVESIFSGLSLGANRHGLFACVNHVKIGDDSHKNYDCLVETALHVAKSVKEAIAAIHREVAAQPYWWGNLILADAHQLAAVEVRGQEIRVEHAATRIFRTNHQPMFGETASPDNLPCSSKRFASAQSRLGIVRSVDELKATLASHDDGDTGICNHGVPLTTVYSYILHCKAGEMTLHVANGLPCSARWNELPLPLGALWNEQSEGRFRAKYPNGFVA